MPKSKKTTKYIELKTPDKKCSGTVDIKNKHGWVYGSGEDINKTKYSNLFRFFIINTPDTKKSVRGKRVSEYGIDEADFINRIKKKISNWYSYGNGYIIKSQLEISGLMTFPPKANFSERVCFCYSDKDEITYFFGHIRNSIAHGRFIIAGSKKDPVMVMEDMNSNGNCSARMVIKVSTLAELMNQMESEGRN